MLAACLERLYGVLIHCQDLLNRPLAAQPWADKSPVPPSPSKPPRFRGDYRGAGVRGQNDSFRVSPDSIFRHPMA